MIQSSDKAKRSEQPQGDRRQTHGVPRGDAPLHFDDFLRPHALVQEHGSPLMVLDCDSVRTQYRRLATALPGVDLHFAIKALPHLAVVATLHSEGSYFDVASQGE